MTEIIDMVTFYGLDVALLAAVTCAAVQLLKNCVLKNCNKKILTFLPFLLGILLYAALFAAENADFFAPFRSLTEVAERGFSVGALSTVIYVCYEQFIRGSNASAAESIVATLIGGYVSDESLESAAKEIAEAVAEDAAAAVERAAEILSSHAEGRLTEREAQLLAGLIVGTLSLLSST